MRLPQFNRVSRCQEESGNVTNVGDVTDISTDIDGKARVTSSKRVRDVGTEHFLMSPLSKGSLSCCCFPVFCLSVVLLLPSC